MNDIIKLSPRGNRIALVVWASLMTVGIVFLPIQAWIWKTGTMPLAIAISSSLLVVTAIIIRAQWKHLRNRNSSEDPTS
jgi:hypothetical protein